MDSKTVVQPPEDTQGLGARFVVWDRVSAAAHEPSVALPGSAVMSFASKVIDIAQGVQLVAQLIERDELVESTRADDPTSEELPYLGACDRSFLQRLSIAAMGMLASDAEKMIDWCEKYHTAEGRANHGY